MRARAQPAAVVIGMDCMTGLQSARILARRGVRVIGVARSRGHFACRTRACDEVLEADHAGDELIDCLERLGQRLDDRAVLFPCTDLSVLILSRQRARLAQRFQVIMPPHEVIERLLDKVAFFELATVRGIPVPRGVVLHTREEARSAAADLSFPRVIKPAVKTAAWQARSMAKVYKARDREEYLSLVDRCLDVTDRLLVQEWIRGGDESCFTCNCYLTADGRVVASFVSRKIRQWPPEIGIGCLSVEARNDAVRERTVRLFEEVGFHGLGYAEFKVDERTGEPLLIEPNVARPTGRSAMAEAGGVELLYTMYCDALGRPLPDARQQTYRGVKWIHLRQDARAAWARWRRGELTLAEWWQTWRGPKVHAVFSWSDPVPFLADLAQLARRSRRGARRPPRERVAWTP